MNGKGLIRIRGHHLLCILGFKGLGYSEAFVTNMTRIVSLLAGDPGIMLELVSGCDAICRPCPHRSDDSCVKSPDAEAALAQMDKAVLDRICLTAGMQATVRKAYRAVAASVKPQELGTTFCADCQWLGLGYCSAGLAELVKSGKPFLHT